MKTRTLQNTSVFGLKEEQKQEQTQIHYILVNKGVKLLIPRIKLHGKKAKILGVFWE
jgi:hypothetical protein